MTTTTKSDYQRATDLGYAIEKHDVLEWDDKVRTYWRFVAPDGETQEGYPTRAKAAESAMRHRRGPWDARIRRFAEALDQINPRCTRDDANVIVVALIGELGITTPDFVEADERPGQFYINGRSYTSDGSQWHYRLRNARNSADGFFEALTANSVRAS